MKPPPFALAAPQVAFDADHRPRYVALAKLRGGGKDFFFAPKNSGNFKKVPVTVTCVKLLGFFFLKGILIRKQRIIEKRSS